MRLRLLCSTVLCIASINAHADTFNFSAEGGAGGFSGSGALTGTANSDGSYTVTNITGPDITGLIPRGQFEDNDNKLLPAATGLLDFDGLSFIYLMGDTSYCVNIYYDASIHEYSSILGDPDGDESTFDTSFDVSAVTPEPSSIVLLGTGLLGLTSLVERPRLNRSRT